DSVNGRSIGDVFERGDYEIIKPLLINLFQGQAETFEIEAAIHDELGKRDFHWEFRRFTVGSKAAHSIVNVVGRDITILKQTMKAKVEFEKDLDLASSTQNLLLPDRNEVENQN